MIISLNKARPRKLNITANDKRIEAAARRMTPSIQRWLYRAAKLHVEEVIAQLESGKIKVRKADTAADLEKDLLRILSTFGVRDTEAAGKDIAARLGGDWEITPELTRAILRQKTVRVQNISERTIRAVRDQLRKMLLDAQREIPRPSVNEIARRIRKTWFGPVDQRPLEISAARAELIARTEAAQSENIGIAEGMGASMDPDDEVEWLAHTDNKSGDRHHELMNDERIKVKDMMGSDPSKWFKTPLGRKRGYTMRYPGDPSAPIKETANCRCTLLPIIVLAKKLDAKRVSYGTRLGEVDNETNRARRKRKADSRNVWRHRT